MMLTGTLFVGGIVVSALIVSVVLAVTIDAWFRLYREIRQEERR